MHGKLHTLLFAHFSLLLFLCNVCHLIAIEKSEDLFEHGANLFEIFILSDVFLRSLTILLVPLKVFQYLSKKHLLRAGLIFVY